MNPIFFSFKIIEGRCVTSSRLRYIQDIQQRSMNFSRFAIIHLYLQEQCYCRHFFCWSEWLEGSLNQFRLTLVLWPSMSRPAHHLPEDTLLCFSSGSSEGSHVLGLLNNMISRMLVLDPVLQSLVTLGPFYNICTANQRKHIHLFAPCGLVNVQSISITSTLMCCWKLIFKKWTFSSCNLKEPAVFIVYSSGSLEQ